MDSTARDTEVLLSRAESIHADIDLYSDGSDAAKDSLDDHDNINDDVSDGNAKPPCLSIHSQKALLVNRELDEQGMGRYQWMVFFLCGFGYLLDLLWAQAFGLVVSPMQREFGFDDTQLGNIFTAFSIGLTAGALIWGVFVDLPTVGRKAAFNYTVLMSTAFGICLGIPDSYGVVIVLTAFTGFGIGGNIPIDTTICLECLPQDRHWLLPALSIFQPVGVILCSGLAYVFIPAYSCAENLVSCNRVRDADAVGACCGRADNQGWRYLMFTIGAMTFSVFALRFLVFRFQESPKFLISSGQDEKAIEVLQYIARYNHRECRLTLEKLMALGHEQDIASLPPNAADDIESHALLDSPNTSKRQSTKIKQKLYSELSRLQHLFSTPSMTRLIILVWIIYGFDFWGFTIAGSFLPTILARKGQSLGLSLTDTYRSYIYIYSLGIPGVLAGTLMYTRRQYRRLALVLSSALFATCLFAFTAVHDHASYIAVNALVYFFQSMFNALLYAWTPEAFPPEVRGTASGLASFWGRMFSIVAPVVATRVLARSLDGVLYLAGASVWVCTLAVLAVPGRFFSGRDY
ncbi:hypothetical protein LTR84_003084 [Exophiala bonariae]|uniref:Major facilitator superfamily (MFS) profile domain-containing protein n=1 Tax=Exophiala bonariae TaxID=1690606 RepID=A0AAV9NBS5_9EURO|nr:hypothetical protein LTR84_003084 [Exophiala bonariae]